MRSTILYLLVILLLPLRLHSCSCDTISFSKAIQFSDEIFTGRIIRAKGPSFLSNSKKNQGSWRFLFEIEKKWKGGKSKHVIIEEQNNSCDFIFDLRKDYLVYANYPSSSAGNWTNLWNRLSNPPLATTWLCSRTTSRYHSLNAYNWYSDDLVHLDKVFPGSLQTRNSRTQIAKWIYRSLSILCLLGVFLAYRRFLSRNP